MGLFKAKKENQQPKNTFQVVAEYVQALIGAVLLAILIRGFVFEPFKIPSESMVPTLLVGDHIFVARYKYGLRVPFTKIWLKEFDGPQRGDVVVFNYPADEDVDFIKRVVGLPGDTVAMKDGKLLVNGKEIGKKQFYLQGKNKDNACVMDVSERTDKFFPKEFKKFPYYLKYSKFEKFVETFGDGEQHMMQRSILEPNDIDFEIKVPERQYFVMGDNRDHSLDSRIWGMVPRENLKGKAIYIWLSLNHERTSCAYNFISPDVFSNVRWDRFGREIR